MSSQGQSNAPSGQKSPGKGGKSLQLMQQRMQAQSHEQQQAPPQQPDDQQPQQVQQQIPQQQQQSSQPSPASQNSPSNRPKGKDFAAMSARNHRPSDSEAAVEAAPNPMAPQGSRPKGKDFSALSNRMGIQQQQSQPMTQEQQQSRAAQMQNAARAAAGLPPLVHPTATSVTTTPPTIPSPRNLGQSNVNPATSASSLTSRMHASTSAVQQPASSSAYYQQQQQQQQLQRQQQQTMQRQQQMQQPMQPAAGSHSASSLSTSAAGRAPTSAPTPQVAPVSSYHQPQPALQRPVVQAKAEPTPQPTIEEGHLSLGGPHIVPPVGERIQSLLNTIDPNYSLDSAAEAQVLQLANDFLTKVTQQSFELAQHRGSPALDVQDVQWILAKQWGIVIPGLGPPPTRSFNPTTNSSTKRKRRASGSSTGSASKPKPANTKAPAVPAAANAAN
ncbi:transcription initiation factor TFIID subunit 12 [Fistulifera solaris]|uniref:Transcription initiation factor TFIID subunit 12 n=1 Tax=Fistulifera solaris TaxID=1519565 RepID=A0A1Z5JE96_FISSO|nr:transcription initiation factor TFIID subunit 12 [Fistulifera solaris]|eukprot:GAX12299.1 transcription initiation factor TFIID subunit 12 [Fistulifera solaris]